MFMFLMLFIGIDVCKEYLDVCALRTGSGRKPLQFRVKNDPVGFATLLKRVRACVLGESCQLVFCMESTGGYEFDLACYLANENEFVSVVNPARVKHYAASQGWQNKTDKADARTIASYASKNELRRWHLCDPLRRELCQLNRHRIRLQREQNRFQNWLEHRSHRPELEVKQNDAMVIAIEEQLRTVERTIEDKLAQSPELSRQVQELMLINGAGPVLSLTLICEAGDIQAFESAQQYAAFAGLNPRRRESGKVVGKARVSKAGNKWIRWAAHMPGQRAMKCHPQVQALCKRLEEKHQKPKQIRAAAARKLVMICYGVLKALAEGRDRFYAGPKENSPDLSAGRTVKFKFRRSTRRPRLASDRPYKARQKSRGLRVEPPSTVCSSSGKIPSMPAAP